MATLLILACISDLRSRRIPNRLVLFGIGAAMACHGVALGAGWAPPAGPRWWAPIAGLAAGFVLMLPLYLLRATGAGDVKLLAMVGAFIGATAVVSAALYTLVAGGMLSLVFMLGRGVASQTLSNVRFLLADMLQRAQTGGGARLAPLQTTAARLPYAIAIALGTTMSLWRPIPLL